MNNELGESPLAGIMAATAEAMKAELKGIRAGFDHASTIGSSVEEIVARFLNERLPKSVRAVAGQAVDSAGQRSKQVDVIVYDTARTPMLFTSSGGTQNLVPVEGIVAAVEVKTKLTREELRRSVENCASIKGLQREAVVPGAIQRNFALYGTTWTVPPPYYSIFAFESEGLYAEALNDEIGQDRGLHQQIDSLVCLDRGVCINVALDFSGAHSGLTITPRFSATPDPETIRVNVETANALVVWYALLADTVMTRTPGPAIDVTRYLRSELRLTGTVGSGAAGRALLDRVVDRFSKGIGLDSAIARKIVVREPLTPNELYALLSHPAHSIRDVGQNDPVSEAVRVSEVVKESAKQLSKTNWLARWFPGRDPDEPIET
jgi:hypothetical protein